MEAVTDAAVHAHGSGQWSAMRDAARVTEAAGHVEAAALLRREFAGAFTPEAYESALPAVESGGGSKESK